jgi:hypothetical protein
MDRDYYVVLTGSKSNAGDFLIKYRGKRLLAALRPDRKLVDFNAWEPLEDERLDVVNRSAALILLGGPALQPDMYPAVYPLAPDLSRIRVPVLTMGIGWRSASGEWSAATGMRLSGATRELLGKTAENGQRISVRDYHTLEVLRSNGFPHALMTGCPALYDLEALAKPMPVTGAIRKVGFSLGVGFLWSRSMRTQMEELIVRSRDLFRDARFDVLFHHPLEAWFLETHNAPRIYYEGHREFRDWLERRGISWIDVSGSAEKLIGHYGGCDFHLGYRVHAHMFMCSIGRPSILLAEDGRGAALREVIGGPIFPAAGQAPRSLLARARKRLGRARPTQALPYVADLVLHQIEYGLAQGYPRLAGVRTNIEAHYPVMRRFLAGLP